MGHMEGMEVVVMEVEDADEEKENELEEVKWENFLPRMVLRVLLVEADDSTRQLVGALLRKCNYKVAAISDGLKAWEILKRRHNNIDLILTELDLPSISGYALLTLIMEHDGCKDIPVIIMSSQDSISMVLKCILKGAADFLIKPVRKNELKNLWRHVWKRLANNAGHNSRNLIAGQHKTEVTFENNPATNHSDDNVSSSNDSRRFSEKATDAQGLSLMKHWEETGLSCKEGKHQAKHVKVEELPLPTSVLEDKSRSSVQTSKEVYNSTVRAEDGSSSGIPTDDRSDGPGNHTHITYNIGDELPESSIEAVDLIGRINKQKGTEGKSSSIRELNGHNSTPELELSLKRPLDSDTEEVHERPMLNHSRASALSWYCSNKRPRTSTSSDVELPIIKGVPDSSWPRSSSSDEENKPKILVPQSAHCDPVSVHHHIGLVPLPGLTFDSGIWASPGTLMQSMCSSHKVPAARSPNSALQREESPVPTTSPSLYSDPGTNSSTQGCGRAGDELKITESAEQHGCSSSQVVDPSGSGTHSNDFASQNKNSAHGSGSEITDVKATASGMRGTSFIEDSEAKPVVHDQFRSKMGLHSAEREAALAKFRQKRKGRCFEKKVRYQSRKRLAEQRPRVKGQFVRRAPSDEVLADDKP